MSPRNPATIAARAGIAASTQHHDVMPPLHLSANFAFTAFGEKGRYDYTRSGNPTRDLLAEALAELEGGAGAVITASGLAAITLLTLLLREGDEMVAPLDCYGGTWRLFEQLRLRRGLRTHWVDYSDSVAVTEALRGPVRLVWVETPSNPLLRTTDIQAVADLAHARGALLVVDNTFLSPALQNPIAFGADFVLHSTTKLINGHSDVVGGAVIAATKELHEEISFLANAFGLTGAPFDSWLTLRGLRTLNARVRVQQDDAAAVAALCAQHPAVKAVHYPGLTRGAFINVAEGPTQRSLPCPVERAQIALVQRQQRGGGTVVSIDLHGGEAAARAFVAALTHFTLAESLGGVESLVAHPASMTHASMSAAARERAGIGPGLLRLSLGLEDSADLLADVAAGLARAAQDPATYCATSVGLASRPATCSG